MSAWDGPLAVEVAADGVPITFGPMPDMPAGMRFVSEHASDPDRFTHRYVTLHDPATAAELLNPPACRSNTDDPGLFDPPRRERREPLEAALRDAIAAEHGDPGTCPHGDGLYAHLDVHRPWHVELKHPDCWEGDCDHARDRDGCCAAPARHELWCRGCTATMPGFFGEHAGEPLPECQVDWPCSPVLAMCAALEVSTLGKALGGHA